MAQMRKQHKRLPHTNVTLKYPQEYAVLVIHLWEGRIPGGSLTGLPDFQRL